MQGMCDLCGVEFGLHPNRRGEWFCDRCYKAMNQARALNEQRRLNRDEEHG